MCDVCSREAVATYGSTPVDSADNHKLVSSCSTITSGRTWGVLSGFLKTITKPDYLPLWSLQSVVTTRVEPEPRVNFSFFQCGKGQNLRTSSQLK